MKPFDYVKSINKQTPIDDLKDYSPFLTNRAFSYFIDTVLIANLMNEYSMLDNDIQYQFYINTVDKRDRFSRWGKQHVSDDVKMIMEFYKCNRKVALDYMKLLPDSDLEIIRQHNNKGGVNNGKGSRPEN